MIRKMLIFSVPLGTFLKDKLSLAGSQINLIDVNFHLQKSFEIFDKDSANKIWPEKQFENYKALNIFYGKFVCL